MIKYLALLFTCSLVFAQENRVKIAVIDTGFDFREIPNYLCHEGHKDFTDTGLKDTVGHGTLIAAIIAQNINPTKSCLIIVKYYSGDLFSKVYDTTQRNLTEAINYAKDLGVKYINISASGSNPNEDERKAITTALSWYIRVIVAAGNKSQNLSEKCNAYPACYPMNRNYDWYIVGSTNRNGSIAKFSNFNGPVNQYEEGYTLCADNLKFEENRKCNSGTSVSTALFTGKLVAKEVR